MDVGDVSAEGGVFCDCSRRKRRLDERERGTQLGMDFLAVRAEVGSEALRVAAVGVAAAFVVAFGNLT